MTTTISDEITLKIDSNMITLAIVLVSVGGALVLIAILAFMGSAVKFIEKIIVFLVSHSCFLSF